MILIGLVPKSINQPNKTFWGPESKPLVLWKSTFPSRTWISSKLFPRTNQLQLYITWLVLIAHRARWQNLYGTVNFRFKHVRFKEVFRFKEECRCSQNFSAWNVLFKEDLQNPIFRFKSKKNQAFWGKIGNFWQVSSRACNIGI